jgi:PAS domain S-box-containing protein
MELVKNDVFYLKFFENANEAMFIVKDGVYVKCNPKTLEIFKCTERQIIGKTPYDFSPDYQSDGMLSKDKVLEFNTKAIEGIPLCFEWRHCRFDGKIFDAEVILNKVALHNENYILANVRDITVQKNVEQDLKNSEEQFRKILQSVNDAILTANSKGTIVSWNYFAEKIFGYSVDDIIGQNLKVLIPESNLEQYFVLYKQLQLGVNDEMYTQTIEVIGKHKNGKTIPLELSITKMEMSNSLFLTLIIRDIGDRKKKEFAILKMNEDLEKHVKDRTTELDQLNEKLSLEIKKEKHIEERLQKLLHSITDYTYFVTIENNVAIKTTHGEGCYAVTGYWIAEFLTDPMLWFKIIHRDDQKIVNAKIRQLMITHVPDSIEHRIIHKDGRTCWIKNTYVPLVTDGFLIGYDGMITDITERKLLEQKVLNSVIETEEKERLHFSQDLHDSLGPTLSATKTLIQLMKRPNLTFDRNEIFKDIENLLDESIVTIREISFKLSPHILQNYGLIEAIKTFVSKVQQSTNITFNLIIDNDNRFNDKIETIVYRILCECINNTLKHSEAKNVSIRLNCRKQILFVHYSDDGIGFNVATKIAEHKGVGLLNMQSRVNAINGKMNIISNKEKGTTIKLQLKNVNN